MNETIREMDSAFFFTPEYKDIFKYHKEYSSEGEMYADGVFFDDIGYYRFFEVEYLDTKGFIPMVMNVDFDAQVYATTVKGARINVSLTKAIDLATKAYGMDFNNVDDIVKFIRDTASENVINFVNTEVMPAYIDEEGRQVFYDKVMTHIYACLVDKFGKVTPTNVTYSYEQIPLAEGESTIMDWNHSKISDITGATLYGHDTVNASYSLVHDEIQALIDNEDPDLLNVLNCPIVRVGQHQYMGIDVIFYGYELDNNTVVTTNETGDNQHYSALVKNYKVLLLHYTNGVLTKRETNSGVVNRLETFYNYPQYDSSSNPLYVRISDGTQNSPYAETKFISLMDSVGVSAVTKDYNVTGTTPQRNKTVDENYPNYPKSDDDYPVGEPNPDEPTDQDYIWRGVPEPKPPIPPVIGLPPGRRPDVNGDETLPDVGAVEGVYGLFTVYKASVTDLLNLGSFLWQDDTLTALLNIFKNDPMQAIISLHQLYFDPTAPNTRALKLGTVQVKNQSGADMYLNFINDRYQRLACGFVKINRYFNDVRDYQTKISIYLPFIGIRELDINEMLDATVFTDYYVDTYTGDCVATISITRDNSTTKKVLAMYNGNCASPLPLTGADKSRLFANIASIGAGLVSTIATKGATAGGLINSVMNTATSHNITIEKSGSMGGNWGAMGYKKPYFIIERPQTYDAVQKAKIIGYGANLTTSLAQMRGFVRVSAVHVDNIPGATDIEKARIEQLLKEGIFL